MVGTKALELYIVLSLEGGIDTAFKGRNWEHIYLQEVATRL